MVAASPPPDAPEDQAVMGRAAGENFPVASRVLPRAIRAHLLALYGFARLVDELGDGALPGVVGAPTTAARLIALDGLERDLDRAYRGEAEHPLLQRLEPTLRECDLPREPFVRLIEANRMDQRVTPTTPGSSCGATARCPRTRSGSSCWACSARLRPRGWRSRTRSARRCSWPSTARTSPRISRAGACTCRPRTLTGSGVRSPSCSAEHAGAPLRAVLAFEVDRARGLLSAGRAADR